MLEGNILYTQQLDLSSSLNGGAANAGVTYQVPHVYSGFITVSTSGVVSPVGAPLHGVQGAMVRILDSTTGDLLDEVLVVVRRNAEGSLVVGMAIV